MSAATSWMRRRGGGAAGCVGHATELANIAVHVNVRVPGARCPEPLCCGGGEESTPTPERERILANERTFLAGFRTGITLIALGLAAAQFLAHDVTPGIPLVRGLSTMVIATGAFIVVVGLPTATARDVRRIDEAAFTPARVSDDDRGRRARLVVAALGIVLRRGCCTTA